MFTAHSKKLRESCGKSKFLKVTEEGGTIAAPAEETARERKAFHKANGGQGCKQSKIASFCMKSHSVKGKGFVLSVIWSSYIVGLSIAESSKLNFVDADRTARTILQFDAVLHTCDID